MMERSRASQCALVAVILAIPCRAGAGTLRGSASSMEQQHQIAVEEDLTFSRKASQVENLVDSGTLVEIRPNENFLLSGVSFPYARPEVLLFVERLSRQYLVDNGDKLIVTSLTRPTDLQPGNAHKLSVHPAGIAIDFRVPSTAKERAWLEGALLGLENAGVLDVTREKHPPHYHVAVYPAEYRAYAEKKEAAEKAANPIPQGDIQVIEMPVTYPKVAAAAQRGHSPNGLLIGSILTLAVTVAAMAVYRARAANEVALREDHSAGE